MSQPPDTDNSASAIRALPSGRDGGWRRPCRWGQRVAVRSREVFRLGWFGARLCLDWLIPPVCAVCGDGIVKGDGLLCGNCFAGLRFIHPPFCDACALPITQDDVAERGWLCTDCEYRPPVWHRTRAAFLYEGQARKLIMGLKYGSRSEHAATLARFMASAGADLFKGEAVMVPVPVHRWRLWRRGYNQAALLANAVSRRAEVACCPDGLQRRYSTRALARLSRAGRQAQVRGAITVKSSCRETLRGRRIVLVDDIMTTGATAEACVKALLENGCASVDILVAARVTLA